MRAQGASTTPKRLASPCPHQKVLFGLNVLCVQMQTMWLMDEILHSFKYVLHNTTECGKQEELATSGALPERQAGEEESAQRQRLREFLQTRQLAPPVPRVPWWPRYV
ncbi:hypothetical protein AK812_SmicGene47688, partial [Symbiodinium microadriaticum]